MALGAPSGILYSYNVENFRAAKVLIAAEYSKADVKLYPNFVFGETNKTEDFLKKFPSGKVPAFESRDGKCLQESNAIAYYVSNEQLRGESDYERAEVLQWIVFAESEVPPAACTRMLPDRIVKKGSKSNEAAPRAKDDLKTALSLLNGHLLSRTYLVGEHISLADIVVACHLLNPYKFVLDEDLRKPFFNVNKWFNTLINQPEFKAILGEVQLATGQAAEGKKKKDDKEEKKRAKPKSKNPLETFPKGTFDLDDFKRFYSNEDGAESVRYFWEKFDSENYSIWYAEYKYPEQLSKILMNCNLITGMFQKLDKIRKYAFASMCIFGEDNNSTISGIWVWRGHELAFTLSPSWEIDYESYNWRKLDLRDVDAMKLVGQYFSWTGTDKGGRKFNQGKIFK